MLITIMKIKCKALLLEDVLLSLLEQFSFECRKVIAFAFATLHDWLKNSHQFFIQTEVKPKPIVTHSHAFSRALCQLPVITLSLDWFTVLCVLCDWLE